MAQEDKSKDKNVDNKNYKPDKENDPGVEKTHEQVNKLFTEGTVDKKEKNNK